MKNAELRKQVLVIAKEVQRMSPRDFEIQGKKMNEQVIELEKVGKNEVNA